MSDPSLVDRMASLPNLRAVPRTELEWLAEHGTVQHFPAGTVVARAGEPVEDLYIVLSGSIAIKVDRGVGPRTVIRWSSGDPTGMLPYSRMKAPPGDNYADGDVEGLSIHTSLFPELINKCPVFTACTVHGMLDRARSFNTGDLQDEKMVSLGKLAAGLAHELNNPASAILRSAKHLIESLDKSDAAARAVGSSSIATDQFENLLDLRRTCRDRMADRHLSSLERMDLEDSISDWLEHMKLDPQLAERLGECSIDIETLNRLSQDISGEDLPAAVEWMAAGCVTTALSVELEEAAGRIFELVASVKNFTYMDHLGEATAIDVEAGIRTTLRVLGAKARSKSAVIDLDFEKNLPCAHARGAELNQVWMNLIDNALDAISESGCIRISGRRRLNQIVVCVVDDGPGIPDEIKSRIFDAFFTTKPPGQGTGLGLELSRRIVRRNRGEITVESRPGHTAFFVSLPIAVPETLSESKEEETDG